MVCCLNPACQNPPSPNGTKFCSNCGTPLLLLGHYRPLRRLGSGGFSTTYLAEDVDKFNELGVIKQFAPNVQGSWALQKATELFEQEARRLQQLGQHPQIPTLWAYFEQDNCLYLVQQYIEGQNLRDELQQQGAFSEQKIWELLLDVLGILKAVHQQNVIHRDIKPDNIIRRSPQLPLQSGANSSQSSFYQGGARGGQLVLIDFGASKQLSATVTAKPGTKIGTFGYAPPEQMEDREAYPASDLYSLGATCFHLLTGIEPWELWKKQGYGWINNWRQHLGQPVSQELGRILDKLLQEDYQQRYPSAQEVLQDLNPQPPPAVAPTVFSPRHPSPPPPAVAPTVVSPRQPSPTPVASTKQQANVKKPLLVGGVILLLGLGGYGYWQSHPRKIGVSPDSSQPTTNPTKALAYENLALDKTLTGHPNWVGSLAITPDGQTLVSGGWGQIINIWNLQTGELNTTLSGHSNDVNCLAISPDGQTLVSGSRDKTIKIWNLQTGELKTTLTGYSYVVSSLAITPDGQTLVSGSRDNTIKIWNLQTGELKTTLTGHFDWVFSLAITPDGRTLVSGSGDKTIKIWRMYRPDLNKGRSVD
jgi:serine/threonine protein kinase